MILIVNLSLLILFIAYKSKQQPQQQQQSQSQSFPIIPEEEEDKTKRLFYNNNNNNSNNNVKLPLRPFSRPKQQNATSQRQLASIRSFQNIHHNNLNLNNNNNNNNNKACCLLQSPKQQTLSKKIELSKIIIQHNLKPHQPQQQQPPQQNERNIESPSTSAFTVDSTKKYLNDTRTQDDFNKERIHLLSAHLSYKPHTNTLLCSTIKRPMSNVNNGSNSNYDELLCSGFELNRKHIQPNKLRNSHSSNPRSFDNLCHNNKHRDINHSANKRKIHRIKIEKGLMSTKLADKLIHKLNYDIKAQSFKDSNGNIINNNILINSFNF